MPRPLNKIAADILTDWGTGPVRDPKQQKNHHRFGLPYLYAMLDLQKITDRYGMDDGEDIVLRFLTNVTTWRGEAARRLKAELNEHLKEKANAGHHRA